MDRLDSRRIALLFGIVLAVACGGALLLAQAGEPVYAARKDYAAEWGRYIILFGVASAAALIAYVFAFRRKQLAAMQTQWVLFIGVCVLPAPVMLLSSAVGLEEAKAVSFCQSCHVMQRFVEDMENPASTRLAAQHFKNRYIQDDHCYTCHTDYGLFGTVQAKVAGLGHIWKDATGSYRLPVRIAHPYRFTICLDCHAPSAKFAAQPKHEGVVAKVVAGEAACTSCHGPSHLSREERGEKGESR